MLNSRIKLLPLLRISIHCHPNHDPSLSLQGTLLKGPQYYIQLVDMSREVYAPPSLSAPSASLAGPSSESTGAGPATTYLCGECNSKVGLVKGEPIRCKECGHRVLYKERTKR